MKKLLFVTALLAMGTMAMGETKKDSITSKEAKAEVLVKAQIVDDFFKITDIDGNPLVLDFKKVPKANYELEGVEVPQASVEYKVTANDTISENVTLAMSLTSYEHPEDNTGIANNIVTISKDGVATGNLGETEKIDVNLSLDAEQKTIKQGQKVVVGKLNGAIKKDLTGKTTGKYFGKVFLRAEMQ